MIFHRFGKGYFEKVFTKPDPWGYALTEYEATKYRRQLGAISKFYPRPENILEVGCAEGIHTAMLAEAFPGARILGIDISCKAVKRAKENCRQYPKIEIMEADIFELFRGNRLPRKEFDVVLQSEFLYYQYPRLFFEFKLHSYFRQTMNLLKDDGILVTSNGINFPTGYLMEFYYLILTRLGQPVWEARHREWNKLRRKYISYDLKVFRVKS